MIDLSAFAIHEFMPYFPGAARLQAEEPVGAGDDEQSSSTNDSDPILNKEPTAETPRAVLESMAKSRKVGPLAEYDKANSKWTSAKLTPLAYFCWLAAVGRIQYVTLVMSAFRYGMLRFPPEFEYWITAALLYNKTITFCAPEGTIDARFGVGIGCAAVQNHLIARRLERNWLAVGIGLATRRAVGNHPHLLSVVPLVPHIAQLAQAYAVVDLDFEQMKFGRWDDFYEVIMAQCIHQFGVLPERANAKELVSLSKFFESKYAKALCTPSNSK